MSRPADVQPEPPTHPQGPDQPLTGMRVVEVSAFVAAPSGGMTLAQLGADVIRIDPPRGGLDYRRWPVTATNTSLFWAGLNKGKRSVAIDISRPEGRDLAQAVIAAPGPDAGLLLTNMPARGWLDYDQLRCRRPDLIQLTVQGDRHGGSAVDYTLNPRLGLPYLTGPVDGSGVVNHVLPAWDLITGQMAATGLLAAERYRTRHGAGQHVKLPLEDVALAIMAGLGFVGEVEQGGTRPRYGNHLFGAFGRDFVSRDGKRLMVVGLTGKQWQSLISALQLEVPLAALARHLSADFSREGERFSHRDALSALVESAIGSLDLAELRARFTDHSVCWGPYQTVAELVHSDPACSLANPLFAQVEQPGIGPSLTPASALNFSRGRLPPQPAPTLGQDTEAVLLDLVGISAAAFGRLVDAGVVATAAAG